MSLLSRSVKLCGPALFLFRKDAGLLCIHCSGIEGYKVKTNGQVCFPGNIKVEDSDISQTKLRTGEVAEVILIVGQEQVFTKFCNCQQIKVLGTSDTIEVCLVTKDWTSRKK